MNMGQEEECRLLAETSNWILRFGALRRELPDCRGKRNSAFERNSR